MTYLGHVFLVGNIPDVVVWLPNSYPEISDANLNCALP